MATRARHPPAAPKAPRRCRGYLWGGWSCHRTPRCHRVLCDHRAPRPRPAPSAPQRGHPRQATSLGSAPAPALLGGSDPRAGRATPQCTPIVARHWALRGGGHRGVGGAAQSPGQPRAPRDTWGLPGGSCPERPQPGAHRSPVPAPALCAAAPNPFLPPPPPPPASQHGHCSAPTSAPRCPRSAPRYGRGDPLGAIRIPSPIPGGAAARPLPSAGSRLAPTRLRRGCGSHA